jgi:phosphoglycolate phosphatase
MTRQGLLIFDLDGTLFQTHAVSLPAVQEVFRSFDLPVPSTEKILSFFGRPGTEWHPWLRSQCPPEQAAALVAAVDRREMELIAERGQLYTGAREALEALRKVVAQMAICTNGPHDYVETVLQSQSVAVFFDVVRYRKPDDQGKPQMMADLLERVTARPAVVIGDRWDDIEAARANGLQAIGAGYGYGSLAELGEADVLAREIGELPGLVEELLGRET